MIKKMVILLALTLFASTAFAEATIGKFSSSVTTVPGFGSSNKVLFGYESAGGTDPNRYVIATKHTQGDTVYATYSGSTALFRSQNSAIVGMSLTTASVPTVPETPSTSVVIGNGTWESM